MYRDDRALSVICRSFRCTDCMEEVSSGLWADEVPLIEGWFAEGYAYLICGEAEIGGIVQFDAWTFRIGGGPPVHSDVASDCQ